MNYLRRLTLFLTTTRVSTIAVVVALYHILEFALWFGSYSTGTLTLVDLMRCRNENVTTCGASYDSSERHFRILCKPDCQYIDIKECAKLDITYNAWSNTYRALDEDNLLFPRTWKIPPGSTEGSIRSRWSPVPMNVEHITRIYRRFHSLQIISCSHERGTYHQDLQKVPFALDGLLFP
ncbi:hypothetical protein RRG08_038532 [Elysia crispata]|uniref:Uncharacterized protein n=1 Tax=Elysia crispata TaxID=231223 RepID=A0AAE1B1H2_9GAST|nr:hypothetical protein RRG08_038532 [Elysia crispata]